MRLEKKISLHAFEVEYIDQREAKPRTLHRESIVLDGGRMNTLDHLNPAAFQPAQVFTGSVIPAACWASSMRWALMGCAFALFHARCRHSAKAAAPLR